jgi:hypothetical protein
MPDELYRYTFPRPSRPDGALPMFDDPSGSYQGLKDVVDELVFIHSAFRELEEMDRPAVVGIERLSNTVMAAVEVTEAVRLMQPLFAECADYTANAMIMMVRVMLAMAGENATEPITIQIDEV